jgi:hypothetical protein
MGRATAKPIAPKQPLLSNCTCLTSKKQLIIIMVSNPKPTHYPQQSVVLPIAPFPLS